MCCVLWSSYGPEGPGTTCSVQWQQRSATARSYITCLFVFCLLLPLLLMIFCYGRILLALQAVARQVSSAAHLTFDLCLMRELQLCHSQPPAVFVKAAFVLVRLQVSRINRSSAERRDSRVLLMVVSMVTGYLLCWLPYGVMAMLASFGRPGVVPPAASLIPSLLAKTSTVLNPFIYVLLNNQVITVPCKHSVRLPHSHQRIIILFSFFEIRFAFIQLQIEGIYASTKPTRPLQLKDRFTVFFC